MAADFRMVNPNKIASEGNRKYTKDDGFEQLESSIREVGIIEPLTIRQTDRADEFRIVAGRRRLAAALHLQMKLVPCVVLANSNADEDQVKAVDEAIALAENVNRLEMHPLDEAALFARMAERGASIEEIAKHYARSPSAIYKRLRLSGLIEELKAMFRDGWLNISAAAVLAELPEEDQRLFHEESKARTELYDPDDEIQPFGQHTITSFVAKRQKHVIGKCMAEACDGCGKRTHNEGNELFDDYCMSDVCLDADCYRKLWKELIEAQMTTRMLEIRMPTDAKIYFSGGTPQSLYKQDSHLILEVADQPPMRFEVLKEKDYEFTHVETERKKDCCWRIHENPAGDLLVLRVGYKKRPPREQQKTAPGAKKGESPVEKYGAEELKAVAAERDTTPEELAKSLADKKVSGGKYGSFKSDICDIVRERVFARRIKAEDARVVFPADCLSIFMEFLDNGIYLNNDNSFFEDNYSARQLEWLKTLTGCDSLKKYLLAMPEETLLVVQKIFHFLLLSALDDSDMIDIDDLKDIEKQGSLFWKYAGMGKDEYKALYLDAANEVVAEALDPKPKQGGKKKAAVIKKGTADGATETEAAG